MAGPYASVHGTQPEELQVTGSSPGNPMLFFASPCSYL